MGFAVIFFAFAALFTWAGESFRAQVFPGAIIIAAIFYQAAAAELFTGFLYLGASLFKFNPGALFKTQKGEVRMLPRFFAWPYLFFELQGSRRYRRRTREPLFEEVSHGLYLGARVLDSDVPALTQAGISAVLDLIAEFEAPPELRSDPGFLYAAVPVLDGTAPTLKEMMLGAHFLAGSIEAGRKALVHCTFGHGRSALMAAAALMVMGKAKNPSKAMAMLEKLNRKIWLSREQKRALREFADMIQ